LTTDAGFPVCGGSSRSVALWAEVSPAYPVPVSGGELAARVFHVVSGVVSIALESLDGILR